jgi:phosphoenolpyruvate-protein phosphotransferase (PTS system enzyme I)
VKSFHQIFKEAENKISGVAAAPGIVVANAYLFIKDKLEINHGAIVDVDESLKNFEESLAKSKKELAKILDLAKQKVEDTRVAIFEAQVMILDDPVLIGKIRERITNEKKQPESIVDDEISKYQKIMIGSDEAYLKERAHDIEDIKNRIIRNLQKKRWESKIPHYAVVISDSLTPADTILFTRCHVQAFITDHGGLTSHAAIISRSLNIPAVVGTHNATQQIKDGDTIIVDGFHGYAIINPKQAEIDFFRTKHERLVELQKGLEEFIDKPAITKDGKEIKLMANVDVTGEIDLVVSSGAKGIGLYRTEQVIDELGEIPSEDEQVRIYSNLSSRIYPETFTIRAFDIGGDKFRLFDYDEPNPFLGLRGIRFLLENIGLFKTQIRAILRASHNKNIKFMLPMVSTIAEITKTKELVETCKKELKKEGLSFDKNLKLGIMIEVPSAAVMSNEFAKVVDFISIGTNDLIQYLMAVDRGNDLVSNLYQEFNPAVVKTLSFIINSGKKEGIEVGLCGEMAADTLAIPLLVGLGLESLSISPSTILYAKRIIRNISFESARKMAEDCLSCAYEHQIAERIENFFKENQITRTRNII